MPGIKRTETTKFKIQLTILIFLIVVIIYAKLNHKDTYDRVAYIPPKIDINNFNDYKDELYSDLKKYNIPIDTQILLRNYMTDMTIKSEERKKENKKKKKGKQLVNSVQGGVVRGLLIGGISSGIPGAVSSGSIFGAVNPLMEKIKPYL